MSNPKRYVGIHNDLNGGMTDTGKIIRDAWVFGIIPESETCEGWLAAGIEDLWRKVNQAWEEHGFLVGNLPDDLRARFIAIHDRGIERAKSAGWDGEQEVSDDS